MAQARVHVPESLNDLLRSDWEMIIEQSALGEENTKIAKMYLLDAIPQIDIAVEFNLSRSTVSKRMLKILSKVEKTARKMNIC